MINIQPSAAYMLTLNRAEENPILSPTPEHPWEAQASFNPCVLYDNGTYHMVYRALSPKQSYFGHEMELSTIGYAQSTDGIHFTDRKQLIVPEHEWEFYGCEDPRITKIDDTYYIFYTALSAFPFTASGIRVGLATTKDFKTIETKHLITPFNAKAMCLFPEKVQGNYAVMLTVNTDQPPADVAMAFFDRLEELWDPSYWQNWYRYRSDHTIPLRRDEHDHVEIGAPPLKTSHGWLLVYSYIKDYFSDMKQFSIQGALLQSDNPLVIQERTTNALLFPEKPYEKQGNVNNVVFPSGAVLAEDTLSVYYSGADTVSCLAKGNFSGIMRETTLEKQKAFPFEQERGPIMFKRFEENPILLPKELHQWEQMAVCNPAAVKKDGAFRLFYRAISEKRISTIGYAESTDGVHITLRLPDPVYLPQESFETNQEDKDYGCEDPRVTILDDTYYLCYTAYDGKNPSRIALTSITSQNVAEKKWHWEKPKLISPPGVADKAACLFPKKIQNSYTFLHQLEGSIWLDQIDSLDFLNGEVITGKELISKRPDKWDSELIGLASPPLETNQGWLVFYYGIDRNMQYNIGAFLLDGENPSLVQSRLDYPLLDPEMSYETQGIKPNCLIPCGTVLQDDQIFLYYGASETVVGVATISVTQLLTELQRYTVI